MKKILTFVFMLVVGAVFSTTSAQTMVNTIELELVTFNHIVVSVDFHNPDSSKKANWIIKIDSEFMPITGGVITAVDGSMIDITSGLQPETSYEIQVSTDTFNSYVSITVPTPAAPVSVGAISQKKAFTARATGTNFVIQAEKATNYKIYNILGSQVLSGSVDAGETKNIDASGLQKGYYFISNDVVVIKLLHQ